MKLIDKNKMPYFKSCNHILPDGKPGLCFEVDECSIFLVKQEMGQTRYDERKPFRIKIIVQDRTTGKIMQTFGTRISGNEIVLKNLARQARNVFMKAEKVLERDFPKMNGFISCIHKEGFCELTRKVYL